MSLSFRDFLSQLEQQGELIRVPEEIDIKELSARTAESSQAVWFEQIGRAHV